MLLGLAACSCCSGDWRENPYTPTIITNCERAYEQGQKSKGIKARAYCITPGVLMSVTFAHASQPTNTLLATTMMGVYDNFEARAYVEFARTACPKAKFWLAAYLGAQNCELEDLLLEGGDVDFVHSIVDPTKEEEQRCDFLKKPADAGKAAPPLAVHVEKKNVRIVAFLIKSGARMVYPRSCEWHSLLEAFRRELLETHRLIAEGKCILQSKSQPDLSHSAIQSTLLFGLVDSTRYLIEHGMPYYA